MSEPIVYADQWRPLVEAAGYRCQCTGACGNKHTKGNGRCERKHDQYADKHHGPARLVVAPDDPAVSVVEAATVPPERLRAWCTFCLDAARRAVKTAARKQTNPEQDGLFDPADL